MNYQIPLIYQEYIKPFKIEGEPLAAVKDYLQMSRQALFALMEQDWPALKQVQFYSYCIDQIIRGLYARASQKLFPNEKLKISLLAQGGYGRLEMNLYSDVDILFFYGEKSEAKVKLLSSELLYPLWDAGLAVGHATRNLKDCRDIIRQDPQAFSSMLDARYLDGDVALAEKFLSFIGNIFSSRKILHDFLDHKVEEKKDRINKFGNSVYLSEPNVKESEGGLRDWHLIRYTLIAYLKSGRIDDWVLAGLLTNEEADIIARALEFLWHTRNVLHWVSGRCTDKLLFQYQEAVAQKMGFVGSEARHAVEQFMQTYYQHAANLNKISAEVLRRVGKGKRRIVQKLRAKFRPRIDETFLEEEHKIVVQNYAALEKTPLLILKAFYHFQNLQTPLDGGLLYWIRTHLHFINDAYRQDTEVNELLRKIFFNLGFLGETLKVMHECGFFGALLPEFGEISFQAQHDVYHFFTVDTHLILAVDELSKLWGDGYDEEFPQYKEILQKVERPDLLVLGVLFHDIGKGKGGNHSNRGADIAVKAMQRMGYPPEDQQVVDFLVRSHLIMSHLSQRRDLEDTGMVENFASTLGSSTNLDLLLLLTWADIRAVGPEVWTAWKGSLLENLYFKTKAALEEGERNKRHFRAVAEARKQEILQVCQAEDSKAEYSFFNSLPRRYYMVHKPATIQQHLELIRGLGEQLFTLRVQQDEKQGVTRVFLFTYQNFQIMSRMTGVLASCGINILSLVSYAGSSGGVLLLLRVTDPKGLALRSEKIWERFQERLQSVLLGKVRVAELFAATKVSPLMQKVVRQLPPKINIDNDLSAYYTVIEIFANDRVGLLYEIISSLEKLGVYIDISKISTEVDQAADIFYVKDIFGGKITEPSKIKSIRHSLQDVLEPEKIPQGSNHVILNPAG